MRLSRLLLLAPLLGPTALAGCGTATSGADPVAQQPVAGRGISVTMADNRFQPDTIYVRRGETVTLRFHNAGKSTHEALVGDKALHERHEIEMSAGGMEHSAGGAMSPGAGSMDHRAATTMSPGAPMDHGAATTMSPGAAMDHGAGGSVEPDAAVTIAPGQDGELTRRIDEEGSLIIGCHQPGHWADGMKSILIIM